MMSFSQVMDAALAVVVCAIVLTLVGLTSGGHGAPHAAKERRGGPYRSSRFVAAVAEARSGLRLVAIGSGLLACAAGPALVAALLSLRWEGVGVTLLPALLLVVARLYGALHLYYTGNRGTARTISHASLLLDVPLLAFSLVHMRLIEAGHAHHDSLSLAAVAGMFAAADGLQASLVLIAIHARKGDSGPIGSL